MKGRWAGGIEPRHFVWVLKDSLAVSERPGGHSSTHRRIRRQEEVTWLLGHGFTRVVSLLPTPHNLHSYAERGIPCAHLPVMPSSDMRAILPPFYVELRGWLAEGGKVLVHHEELSDTVLGVVGGYLLWSHKLASGAQALAATEALAQRSIGTVGRAMVLELEAFRSSQPSPLGR